MFIDFLRDTVANMDKFRADIAMLYLYPHENNLIGTGNHPNRLIFYQVVPVKDLSSHLLAPAYMGAIGYLNSLLDLTMLKQEEEPKVEITYKERGGERFCVNSLRFVAKRFDANFECTNPEILNEKDRIRTFPRPDDPIFFSVNKDMRKEFDEVIKTSAPKADTRLFTLGYDGTYIRAMFGSGKHTTNFIITKTVDGHTDQKFQKLISLDRFKIMYKLASEYNGRVGYHPNAAWVDFTTAHASHMIATPTIREQTK